MPGKKAYTLILTHHEHSRVRVINIPHFALYIFIFMVAAVLCGAAAGAVHYWKLSAKLADYRALARENIQIRLENENYRLMSQHIREKISFLEMLSKKLSITAGLESAKATRSKTGETSRDFHATPGAPFAHPLDELKRFDAQVATLETSLRNVNTAYNEQFLLSSYTPSIWPVPGGLSRGFGSQVDPWTGEGEHHRGVDISARYGQRVQAAAAGVVVFSGYRGDYGNLVVIDHKFGLSTLYGHLMRASVRAGQPVRRYDVIGYVGSTGRSTGPHLHYEVRRNNSPVNPYKFLFGNMAREHRRSVRPRTDAD